MEEPSEISILFEKYLAGYADQQDIEKLYKHFEFEGGEDEFSLLIQSHFQKEGDDAPELQMQAEEVVERAWPLINGNLGPYPQKPGRIKTMKRWTKYAAAAILCLVVGYGISTLNKREVSQFHAKNSRIEDIKPGSNHAILKVGDEMELELKGDNSSLVNRPDRILYADGTEIESLKEKQNIQLRTPNGGIYTAILNDGTKVWLNAGSEIVYPSVFEKGIREVYVKGEVYFEVAKDQSRPFVVHSKNQKIEVLGTRFNVNAYENEAYVKTTLISGSVRISDFKSVSKEGLILSPNEQSIVGPNINTQIHKVDPKAVVSWKNGYFNFHKISLDESLKQIERWYDIKVVYKGKKLDGYLGGKMSRGVQLSSFVTFIEQNFNLKAEFKADRTLILYDHLPENK